MVIKKQIGRLSISTLKIVSHDNFDFHPKNLSPLEVIFSTWGMPVLNVHQLIKSPKLKAVFYAASSVKALPYPSKTAGYDC